MTKINGGTVGLGGLVSPRVSFEKREEIDFFTGPETVPVVPQSHRNQERRTPMTTALQPRVCWRCHNTYEPANYRGTLCTTCQPHDREDRDQAARIFDRREYQVARHLYNSTGAYMLDLAILTRRIGYFLHHNQYRHTFPRNQAPEIPGWTWGSYSRPHLLDHPVLLRHQTGLGFAVLSQVYGDPDGRGILLGPAPYGHGTTAELWPCRNLRNQNTDTTAGGRHA